MNTIARGFRLDPKDAVLVDKTKEPALRRLCEITKADDAGDRD